MHLAIRELTALWRVMEALDVQNLCNWSRGAEGAHNVGFLPAEASAEIKKWLVQRVLLTSLSDDVSGTHLISKLWVCIVAAERRYSLQTNMKTPMRSTHSLRLSFKMFTQSCNIYFHPVLSWLLTEISCWWWDSLTTVKTFQNIP